MTDTSERTEDLKIGVTFHSFTSEFVSYIWAFEDLMVNATQLGGGVEIVGPVHHRQFPHVPPEFITAFRNSVERNELTPTAYGSYADPFMRWDRSLTDDELVDYTIPQIEGAAKLGFPIVRLQYYAAPIVERVLPLAERLNVKLGYELHAPLALESEITQNLVEQIRRIRSEHLGLIPDASIFARTVSPHHAQGAIAAGLSEEDRDAVVKLWEGSASTDEALAYVESIGGGTAALEWAHHIWGSHCHSDPAGLRDIADYVIHVHGKFYSLTEDNEEPALRYQELVQTLVDIDYKGWISSEYEGAPADSFEMVARQQEMLRRHEREYRAGRALA